MRAVLRTVVLLCVAVAAVLVHNWFNAWLHEGDLIVAGLGPLPQVVTVDLHYIHHCPTKPPSKRRWLTSDLVARRLDR